MMIWSTRNTVVTASTASFSAHHFTRNTSAMFSSVARSHQGILPETSTPAFMLPAACAAYRLYTTSVALSPAFSAKVRGTTSSALANFSIAYWSSPVCFRPNAARRCASSISVAPPAGSVRLSLVSALNAFTPSSTARSMSSITFSVLPRSTTVATLEVASFCCTTTHLVPPISLTSMDETYPSSSAAGRPSLIMPTAFVARQNRRSSNLEGILIAIKPYRSMKCMAISPKLWPETTTLAPLSAIIFTYSSIFFSSPREYFSRSLALVIKTVPLVSVAEVSTAHPKTATFASWTFLTVPSQSLRITMPCTTVFSCIVLPTIFETRTLSTLKFTGFFGRTSMHASAHVFASISSYPNCFDESVPFKRFATASLSLMSSVSDPGTTSSSSHSNTFPNAFSYPSIISLGCNPSRIKSSAFPRSSPPKVTTKFVPSPISCSCACAAITNSFAAGCATSSSRTITAASEVTKRRSRWFMTILFMPLGPRDVLVILLSCLHASTFLITASSRPDMCLWPSLSMDWSP
mmetsp:Transcript_12327/g.45942  ORF Transcript_12327/g.45942 Transcript_12327/m.45942 type:complete len:521 (+) Transcript_12327:160-1722(+)